MSKVNRLAPWGAAFGFVWVSNCASAQTCIPPEAISNFNTWPTCTKLVPSTSQPSEPTLLTAGDTDPYCRLDVGEIVTGDKVQLTVASDPGHADESCVTVHSPTPERSYLAVRLPRKQLGPVLEIRTDQGVALVRGVPASLPGFQMLVAQPLVHSYRIRAEEIKVGLAQSLRVNYGTPRVESITPSIPSLTHEGLDIVIPGNSQPKFASLQVAIVNDYGQRAQVALSLVPEVGYSDSPTLQSLKIELAHIRKLAADERFIRARASEDGLLESKDATALRSLYRVARDSLPVCGGGSACGELSRAQLATAGLLRADIDYRTFLLEKRLTFWGGFRTLRPTTPHHELVKLRDLVKKFSDANKRMEEWQFRSDDKKGRAQELGAEKAYVQGQVKAEDLYVEVKAIETNRWQRLKASNAATKASVESEISKVADRMEKLAQQQEALGKQATSQAINLVASVTGLPVDAVAGAAEGDLKKAIGSYVSAELENQTSALSTELQHFGDTLVEANGTLANLQETYKDIKELQRNVDLVAVGIREPSLERFLKVGELVYAKLDAEQKRQIDQLIDSQKPVQAWLNASYHQVVALQGEIEGYRSALRSVAREMSNLPKSVQGEARSFLGQELKKARSEGEGVLRASAARLLDGIKELQLAGRPAERALVHALAVYPAYVAESNPSLWLSVKARHPQIGDEQLLAQFLAAANASLSMSRSEREAWIRKTGFGFGGDGQLAIENSGQLRYYNVAADIFRVANRIDPARVQLAGQEKMESIVEMIEDNVSSDKLMAYVATTASAEGASAFISRFVSKDRAPQMWKNLKDAPAKLRAEVNTGIRHAMAASIASPALPRPSIPPVPAGAAIPTASSQEQMQNQMAAMALNAAFPGAGTALQLAQTFASMDANRELNATLAQQSAQLISTYQELLRSAEDADFSESISLKEYDRALALAEAAKAQLEQYNGAIDTILDSTRDADARLRLYRPYFFYLAEMLRQRFDIFDRSLAMWSGSTDSRGFFAARIATDPSLARLALDSEIHLFDWLNRDREATKTDPFMLYLHWQQLVALAESYCADNGCKPGDNVLGQIGTTDRMRVFERLATPGKREEFDRWKRGPMSNPFVFRITLDPTRGMFSALRLNVRNLDWNIVPLKRAGPLAGTHVEVRHLGHSQMSYEDRSGQEMVVRFRDESMLASSYMPSNRNARFDAAKLATRFQAQMDIATLEPLRGLEGWGLYGAYELTIANNPVMRDVEDFEIEIAYIFTDPKNITSEQSFVASTRAPGIGDCGSNKDKALAESACRSVYYYTKNDCNKPPPATSHQWLSPDARLEYLYATRRVSETQPMKLCRASAEVPLAKRAMDRQRASEQCNWATALADVIEADRNGPNALLICKESLQ